MSVQIVAGVIALGFLVAVVALRTATGGKIEITLNDTIIAAIAAALTLLISGKIVKIVLGTEGVTIETAKEAILSASTQPIKAQVSALPVSPVGEAHKGGVTEIPELIRRRVQALDFFLGLGAYDPQVMKTYLESLTRYSFFKYVIVQTPDRKLFGILDARGLLALLEDPSSGETFPSFAALLNRGDEAARLQIALLPGFVSASEGVTAKTEKRDVLQQMDKSNRDWLPVVSADGKFEGIVDRSRVVASMILDVTNQLQSENRSNSSP